MMLDEYPYSSPPGTHIWQPELSPAWASSAPVIGAKTELPADPIFLPPKLAVIVGVVIAIASVANATMLPVMTIVEPGPGFALGLGYLSLVMGSMAGQAAVVTVLAVWGKGPLWMRLVWHWGLALLAFSAWTFGLLIAMAIEYRGWSFPTDEYQVAIFGLPLVALACQAVPWLFKLYLGWRIEQDDEPARPATEQRLAIRDILLGMILVAVTMAAVRTGKPANAEEGFYWAAWGIGCAAAAAISLICMVPMVYLTLGVRETKWGALGVVAIAALVAATASGILMWLNPGGPSDKEIILMMSSIAVGFTLTLAGTLWIARRMAIAWWWGGSPRRRLPGDTEITRAMKDHDYPYCSPADAKTWQPVWPPALSLALEAEPDYPLGSNLASSLAILAYGNLAIIPVVFLLSAAASPGFVLGAAIFFITAGSMVGQAALHAILVVWGGGKLWQRVAWQLALIELAFLPWGLGFCFAAWHQGASAWEYAVMVALGLPLLLLFCQGVPWFFRLFLQWRIEFVCSHPRPTDSLPTERLFIRDYMVGTVLVAAALAMVRAGKPASLPEANYWSLWITIGLVLAALSLIAVMPIVYFTLGMRRPRWGVASVLALTGLACVPAVLLLRGMPLPPVPLMIAIPALIGGFTATVAVPLCDRAKVRLSTCHRDADKALTKPKP